ncbi:hypothetical protein AN958_12649 [Leucoagaricus sp. SymC.cos]|nr:hypothetical protein AN958_12649 [Leucoagaricus sp. SymC.cos]
MRNRNPWEDIPDLLLGSDIWLSSGYIASLQNYEPRNILDARTLCIHHLPISPLQTSSDRIYGNDEDAVRILRAHVPQTCHEEDFGNDYLAVEVNHDTDSRIDIITFSPTSPTHTHRFTPFHTSADVIWFNSWDAKRIIDPSDPTLITYIFAVVLSSGPRHEPPNVWSRKVQVRVDDNGAENFSSINVL